MGGEERVRKFRNVRIGDKSVASVQSLDGAAEAEKRRGSGLREVESAEDTATVASEVARTTKSADVAQESRVPNNKPRSSF